MLTESLTLVQYTEVTSWNDKVVTMSYLACIPTAYYLLPLLFDSLTALFATALFVLWYAMEFETCNGVCISITVSCYPVL